MLWMSGVNVINGGAGTGGDPSRRGDELGYTQVGGALRPMAIGGEAWPVQVKVTEQDVFGGCIERGLKERLELDRPRSIF